MNIMKWCHNKGQLKILQRDSGKQYYFGRLSFKMTQSPSHNGINVESWNNMYKTAWRQVSVNRIDYFILRYEPGVFRRTNNAQLSKWFDLWIPEYI